MNQSVYVPESVQRMNVPGRSPTPHLTPKCDERTPSTLVISSRPYQFQGPYSVLRRLYWNGEGGRSYWSRTVAFTHGGVMFLRLERFPLRHTDLATQRFMDLQVLAYPFFNCLNRYVLLLDYFSHVVSRPGRTPGTVICGTPHGVGKGEIICTRDNPQQTLLTVRIRETSLRSSRASPSRQRTTSS